MTNQFGVSGNIRTSKDSFNVLNPIKTELGDYTVVDVCFSDDFTIMILKPSSVKGVFYNQAYGDTLLKQSDQKVKLIKELREGKRTGPPIGSIVLSDFTNHLHRDQGEIRPSALIEFPTSKNNSFNLLSGKKEKDILEDQDYFDFEPIRQGSNLEKAAFKNYYESVFGRPHDRGEIFNQTAESPEDLINLDPRQLKLEYKRLVRKGKDEELIDFAINPRYDKPKFHPVFQKTQFDIKSDNINACYSIIKQMESQISKAKSQSKAFHSATFKLGKEIRESTKHASKCVEMGNKLICLAERTKRVPLEKRKARTGQISPTSSQSPKHSGQASSIKTEMVNYDSKRSLVLLQREKTLHKRNKSLVVISKLKDPKTDRKEKENLNKVLTNMASVQRGVFVVKLIGFLRFLDTMRLASNLF